MASKNNVVHAHAPLPRWRLQQVIRCLNHGGIIAYPTEAVFGLGCDPFDEEAVRGLLGLKKRPVEKGLILIGSEFDQLAPLLEIPDEVILNKLQASWPGPTTWVVPAKPSVPGWLRGNHDSLAVRITDHPIAAYLCTAFNRPLVSTSANTSGLKPAKSTLAVRQLFGHSTVLIVPGQLGKEKYTTRILDAMTDNLLR